jgi:serine/threonine protein kinase
MEFQVKPGVNARNTLRDYVKKALRTCMFGTVVCKYLPSNKVEALASDQNINIIIDKDNGLRCGRETKEQLKSDFKTKGRRMFIISVLGEVKFETLLFLFQDGITDASIPLQPRPAGVEHYDRFRVVQDILLPELKKDGFREYGRVTQIPIETNLSKIASGVGGQVFKACIGTHFHDIPEPPTDSIESEYDRDFAIKQFKSSTPADNNHMKRDVDLARWLALNVRHDHITESYGTFEMQLPNESDIAHFLISEFANFSLENYLRDREKKRLEEAWLRTQIRGLAQALALIHGPTAGSIGFHHDIKPANILIFMKKDSNTNKDSNMNKDGGTLKFTDWGCSKITAYYQRGESPKKSRKGHPPYLPPESISENPTSRPHDIWSLGCVFVELLVWFTEDSKGHHDFEEAVSNGGDKGCWFIIGSDGRPTLATILLEKLGHLESRENGKWRALVTIVRKMFIIEPQDRITAENLCNALNDPNNQI